MTTYTAFTPTPLAPFQFRATLDGDPYNVIVTWNVFGQRWYVNIYATSSQLVAALPLIGSPSALTLETLTWLGGIITATASVPHGYEIGTTVQLTISGCAPGAYNGSFDALITGASTFTYLVASDPGAATSAGAAAYNISMTAGYFASTMVFRDATQTFEVSP